MRDALATTAQKRMLTGLRAALASVFRGAPRRRTAGRFVPRLNLLEDRTTPAGTINATLVNGTLTLTAVDSLVDNALNNQNITLSGDDTSLTLTPADGETIGGPAGDGPYVRVKNLVFDMRLGADFVTLLGVNLPGNVTYKG